MNTMKGHHPCDTPTYFAEIMQWFFFFKYHKTSIMTNNRPRWPLYTYHDIVESGVKHHKPNINCNISALLIKG